MSAEDDGAAGAKRLKPDGVIDTLIGVAYAYSRQKEDMVEEIELLNKKHNELSTRHVQLLQMLGTKDAEIERLQSNNVTSQASLIQEAEIDRLKAELQLKENIIDQHTEEKRVLQSDLVAVTIDSTRNAEEFQVKENQLLAENHELQATISAWDEQKAQEIEALTTIKNNEIGLLRNTVEEMRRRKDKILKLHAEMGSCKDVQELISKLQAKLISISAIEEEQCRQTLKRSQWITETMRTYFLFTYIGPRIDGDKLEDAAFSKKNAQGHSVRIQGIFDMVDGEMHFCKVNLSSLRTLRDFHIILNAYCRLMANANPSWNMTLGPIFSFERSDIWNLNIANKKMKKFGSVPGCWKCDPPTWIWTEVSPDSSAHPVQPPSATVEQHQESPPTSAQDTQQFQETLVELHAVMEREEPIYHITTVRPS